MRSITVYRKNIRKIGICSILGRIRIQNRTRIQDRTRYPRADPWIRIRIKMKRIRNTACKDTIECIPWANLLNMQFFFDVLPQLSNNFILAILTFFMDNKIFKYISLCEPRQETGAKCFGPFVNTEAALEKKNWESEPLKKLQLLYRVLEVY